MHNQFIQYSRFCKFNKYRNDAAKIEEEKALWERQHNGSHVMMNENPDNNKISQDGDGTDDS